MVVVLHTSPFSIQPILCRRQFLGLGLLRMISLLFHTVLHMFWTRVSRLQSKRAPPRATRPTLDATDNLPQTTFSFEPIQSVLHRHSPNLPFPLSYLPEAGLRRKAERSPRMCLDKTQANVCDPASSRRPGSFSFLLLRSFPLFCSANLPFFWVSVHYWTSGDFPKKLS